MMFLTSSILLGFIRLSFIILFLFYLNRKFVNLSRHVNFLDFIIVNWFRYGSILVLMIFILVQLNAYNLFNCFFLLSIIIIIDTIGLSNLRRPRHFFNFHIKAALLDILRNVENKKHFWSWIKINAVHNKKQKKIRNSWILLLTVFIAGITFFSRYYFIIYDNYSLSDSWIYDLGKVLQFDSQVWFGNDLGVPGEFAMINFYSKITDVSAEIALQVIAILESTLLSIIIFWTIHKMTPSKILAPVIASLSFALVYVLTPLNVYFLLKANPIFFAITLALPAFGYYLKPNLLHSTKLTYFMSFVIVFVAIGLIDIFTLCLLVFPFLIIGFLFTKQDYKGRNLLVILAFIFSILILYAIYDIACYYKYTEILEFFQNNMLSVSSYTYVPQLIMPYDEIIRYAQFSTFAGFILILALVIFKRENWRSTFVFLIYFNFLIGLTYIENKWIDVDWLKNSLSVFLPLILGFNLAIVIRILNFAFEKYERFTPVTATILVLAIIFTAIYYQEENINSLTVSDQTPKQILDAYDKIEQRFFPLSYCVVNDPATQVISTNKHFFMNYDFFLNQYSRIDSVNSKHKKDPKFLLSNPEYSLSNSVLVFVLNDQNKAENNIFSLNSQLKSSLIGKIHLLKKRGRKVNLFYSSKVLEVYEIVNEPHQSKILDLIFN